METLMKTAADNLQLLLNDPTSILNRKEFTIISDSFPDLQTLNYEARYMSMGNHRQWRTCLKCGESFRESFGTLSRLRPNYLKCPKCGGDSVYDKDKNAIQDAECRQRVDERMEHYRRIAEREIKK